MSNELITALAKGSPIIETHLSWVILTGETAYKIKKPLNLGFQDYTTLAKRKYYCELEIQLNQQLAADLYIEVVAIYGSHHQPSFEPDGPIIEYAVKMHQFPQENMLIHFAAQNKLTPVIIDDIVTQLVNFHQQTPVCSVSEVFGRPEEVMQPVIDNFIALRALDVAKPFREMIDHIENWAKSAFETLRPLMQQRKDNGFIRACHGDLHLGNIVMINDNPVIFDCIEFNDSFRFTDVLADVAFLAMDLRHLENPSLEHWFVNRYFELTQDFDGIPLLRFYQCYRAMVRAKISAILSKESDLNAFLNLAKSYTQDNAATLSITMGPSGSGKSLYSEQLLMKNGGFRLRSDVIRKHLHGLSPFSKSITLAQKEKLYSESATLTLYHHLQKVAEKCIQHNYSVIIDATCLKEWQRSLFQEVAQKNRIPYLIYLFACSFEVLEQRIRDRALREDVSDADSLVLEKQLDAAEPLNEEEESYLTVVPMERIDDLIKKQRDLL